MFIEALCKINEKLAWWHTSCDLSVQRNAIHNKKEWSTETQDVGEYQKYYTEWKNKKVHTVLFHLYEILE